MKPSHVLLIILAFALIVGLSAFLSAREIAGLRRRVAQLESEVIELRQDTEGLRAQRAGVTTGRTRVRTIQNR